eukprot:gene28148-26363_t
MPSNIVLECSQYQSNSASNSQWTTTFSEEVVLAENDIFQLQQCLLNTQTVSSGSISIEEDTDVTIQVAYYEYALGSYYADSGGADGSGNNINLVNTPLPYAFTTKKDKHGDPDGTDDTRQVAYDNTFVNIQPPPNPASPQPFKPAGLYLLRKPKVGSSSETQPTDNTFELYTADITVTVLSGVYDPAALADMITKKVSLKFDESIGGGVGEKGLLVNLTHNNFEYYGMVEVDTIDKAGTAIVAYTHQIAPNDETGAFRMLGASTFELSFNAGVFSFTNLHSPMMGATGGGDGGLQFYTNPSIGMLMTGFSEKKLRPVDCYSGCVITNLQPTKFWNRLGFSNKHIYDDIVFNDTAFVNIRGGGSVGKEASISYFNERRVKPSVLLSDFRSSTGVGLSSFNTHISYQPVADATHKIPTNDTMELVATTTTDSLDGDSNYIVDEIGYYRVEAETVISNDYKQQGQRLGAVVGIVSTNYSANDFVIGYGDGSSIAYQHSGAPQ